MVHQIVPLVKALIENQIKNKKEFQIKTFFNKNYQIQILNKIRFKPINWRSKIKIFMMFSKLDHNNQQNQMVIYNKLIITIQNVCINKVKTNTLTILNKFEDAKQLYKDIIKINPNIELSYLKIADILRDQKYYQEAKDYYFQCISINQNNSDAYFGIGECLKETQQFYEAQQYYVTAIEINQSNLQYKFCYDKYIYSYQLGNCLRTLGKYHEAICVYDQCQMIDTNHDETIAAIGYK